MMSSKRANWCTPDEVLELVRKVGPIALDPCSNKHSRVRARRELRLERGENGLVQPWARGRGAGLVYVNPPYGDAVKEWCAKIELEAAQGCEVIALLAARTCTAWFQEYAARADAVCFWRGRIKFLGAKSGAPFPSLVLYYGPRPARFRAVFARAGRCYS